jgi:hypothetical protein
VVGIVTAAGSSAGLMRWARRPTASAVPLSAGSGPAVHAMIQIAISVEAFEAIASTLPLGSVSFENKTNEHGERLIWLEPRVVDRLQACAAVAKATPT